MLMGLRRFLEGSRVCGLMGQTRVQKEEVLLIRRSGDFFDVP